MSQMAMLAPALRSVSVRLSPSGSVTATVTRHLEQQTPVPPTAASRTRATDALSGSNWKNGGMEEVVPLLEQVPALRMVAEAFADLGARIGAASSKNVL